MFLHQLDEKLRKSLFSTAILVIAGLNSSSVFAEAWQLVPTLSLEGRVDDNISMKQNPSGDYATEALLRGVLSFSRLTDTTDITGRAHANFSTKTKSNQFFTLSGKKKYELTQWGVDSYYRRDSTVRPNNDFETEIAPTDPDQTLDDVVGDVDEGQTSVEVRRNTFRLKPYVGHAFSERLSSALNYGLSTVNYSNNFDTSGLFDFQQHSIGAGISWKLGERDSVRSGMEVSRFIASDRVDTTVDSASVSFTYVRQITENLRGSGSLGLRRSYLNDENQERIDDGFIARLFAGYEGQVSRLTAKLSHNLEPSGTGVLLETTNLKLNAIRKLRERLSVGLRLRVFRNSPIRTNANDAYFLNASPRIRWNYSRWIALEGGYHYRRREIAESGNDAESNAVFVSIRYSEKLDID